MKIYDYYKTYSNYRTGRPLFDIRWQLRIAVDQLADLHIGQQQFVHLKFALYFRCHRTNRHEYLEHLETNLEEKKKLD